MPANGPSPADRPGLPASAVSRAYDRWARSYDADHNTTRDLDALVLRRAALPQLPGGTVLELGCGTGKNTEWLAAHAARVVALDFSPGMLARARDRVPHDHVEFRQHDIRTTWPVPASSVDLVIGNLVLEHVEELTPVFADAARVLRPGGALYLCELHPFRQWRGGQAHFVDGATGETVHVPAFVHTVSEYVNGAIAAGLTLRQLGEWVEEGAEGTALPRLLALHFER